MLHILVNSEVKNYVGISDVALDCFISIKYILYGYAGAPRKDPQC